MTGRVTTRRDFLRKLGTGGGILALHGAMGAANTNRERPNILWITSEDNGTFLGCYGDGYADTPNLDRLAAEGILYENAFTNAPVCAPSRSTIITGMYACTLGTHHMRSSVPLPASIRFFTEHLRDAGYYCSNRSKEDYNTRKPEGAWDDSSRAATWKNRSAGQPFFSVVNLTVSHESSVHESRPTDHDPSEAPLPPYHPDTPEFRHDWAQYYDRVSELDRQIGRVLSELDEDGLAEETIVFYYSDHAGVLPRSKRSLYDSGIHVPLIVRFPEKYQHLASGPPGWRTDRLVSFVDLAPTVLSLAGIEMPHHMQGTAFLGEKAAPAPEYVFAFRDRMDERYDMSRAIRDQRYKYIRNYMPHLPHGQYLEYLWRMPAMQAWEREYLAGNLDETQRRFFEPKAAEELYDTVRDPHEVDNLAEDARYGEVRNRMREALRKRIMEIRDAGFLPEAEMLDRAGAGTVYELAQDERRYDLAGIVRAAETASRRDPKEVGRLAGWLRDTDSAARYWGAVGCVSLGEKARDTKEALLKALDDPSPSVRVAAAEAVCLLRDAARALPVLEQALGHPVEAVQLGAANALDRIGETARPLLERMRSLAASEARYVSRVMRKAVSDLE